jgi:hypothetical protein
MERIVEKVRFDDGSRRHRRAVLAGTTASTGITRTNAAADAVAAGFAESGG